MSAKVLGEVATVASNGTNGATVIGSGNRVEIALSVGAFVSGMVSAAEVVSEVDFRKALPRVAIVATGIGLGAGLGLAGLDAADMYRQYKQNGSVSDITVKEVLSFTGNAAAAIAAGIVLFNPASATVAGVVVAVSVATTFASTQMSDDVNLGNVGKKQQTISIMR